MCTAAKSREPFPKTTKLTLLSTNGHDVKKPRRCNSSQGQDRRPKISFSDEPSKETLEPVEVAMRPSA